MPKVAVNDIEVYYEIHGQGEPVMLIVGLNGVGAMWGPQIPLFAKDFQTIVPDHRGCGQTSAPDSGYSIAQHASDMAKTLRALGCGPAHIVGSSTGGAIAHEMALDHPDVVRSVVSVSSWAKTDGYFRQQFQVRRTVLKELGFRAHQEYTAIFLWGTSFQRNHFDHVREWIETTSAKEQNLDILLKRIDMVLAQDQLHRLGQIRKPVLVIVGKEDICTPPYLSEELAQAIPGAELAILKGGHFLYKEENPELFYTRVREFLLRH